jgi:hypothetical protein
MIGYAYANNNPATASDPSGLLGSASCTGGMVGGPGRCTGGEDGHHADSMRGFGSVLSWNRYKHGTTVTTHKGRSTINGVDVTNALNAVGAPTLNQLAAGLDRYVGQHRPGGGQSLYDPWVLWDAIFLAETAGYIDHPKDSLFLLAIHETITVLAAPSAQR